MVKQGVLGTGLFLSTLLFGQLASAYCWVEPLSGDRDRPDPSSWQYVQVCDSFDDYLAEIPEIVVIGRRGDQYQREDLTWELANLSPRYDDYEESLGSADPGGPDAGTVQAAAAAPDPIAVEKCLLDVSKLISEKQSDIDAYLAQMEYLCGINMESQEVCLDQAINHSILQEDGFQVERKIREAYCRTNP